MRTRSYTPAVIILVLTLGLASSFFAQQPNSRRQVASADSASSGSNKAAPNSRVTGAVVKSDVNEALSVIQDNYIDGNKLDYNNVF